MLKGYKKSYLVINIILGMLLAFMILNITILKHTSYNFLIATILIPTLFLILIYGYEKKSRRFKYELMFYIFAYCSLFLIITYMIGLFVGFNHSVYKLDMTNLTHNIIPYFILIVVSEVLRYQISRKGDGSTLSYILVTLILIVVDLTLFLTTYDLNTGDGKIKYVCAIMMPSLFKNFFLLYFTKRGGILPSLLYRVMLDLKLVVFPIFPNFGTYFDSVVNTILPALMGFIIHLHIKPYENIENNIEINKKMKKTVLYKYLIFIMIFSIVMIVNILVSCTFKYSMIAIGSGSMTPRINKGDAVIYKRVDPKKDIEIGDILVFKKDKKTVVHRVIEIVEIGNNEKVYYTKGDANNSPDGYPILESDVLGVVKKRVRYVGIPSVVLGEMFNK